jgi:peroxiredoxin
MTRTKRKSNFFGGFVMIHLYSRKFYSAIAALGVAIAVSLCLAGDAVTATGPAIGQAAPQFTLQNQDGANVVSTSFSGKIVVLEWTNPQCPFVQAHYQRHTMTDLAAKYQSKGVQWVAINSSHDITNAQDKQWATQQNIPYPILNDASGAVGHSFGATNTPDMFVIGKDGNLLYKGAIDNDPDGTATDKINYVDRVLSETLAGKPVSIPQTKAYGCTVKYAQ